MRSTVAFFLGILMLLGSIVPENDLGELAKLPELVKHYEFHHSAAGGGLSFGEFLAEHYGAGTKHYAGCSLSPRHQQDHHNLPLRCHHGGGTVGFCGGIRGARGFRARPGRPLAPAYRAGRSAALRLRASAPCWASRPERSCAAPPDAVCPRLNGRRCRFRPSLPSLIGFLAPSGPADLAGSGPHCLAPSRMISAIINFSIRNKLLVGLMLLGLVAWGVFSAASLPLDAIPDVTNNQVQVITQSPALAAQEVEQLLTVPLELQLRTIPGVTEIRSISRFGLSVITVVFDEDVDTYHTRQLVAEKLKVAEADLGQGLGAPGMAPITTGLGEIYQYTIGSKRATKSSTAWPSCATCRTGW